MHRKSDNGSLVSNLPPHQVMLAHVCAIDNFEAASLPTTSPEERKRLLSFIVCGGGPTGVETAAEIYDLCQEDIMKYVRMFDLCSARTDRCV